MNAKDLTKVPPRSPRIRVRGYAILARAVDKCRANSACTAGDYHFGCPLDRMLFAFKGVTAVEFKHEVERGTSDEEMGRWLDTHGTPRTPQEICAWSDRMERYSPYDSPEKREYFQAECQKLGLDPTVTTAFDWLELDDRASFQRQEV